MRRIEPLLVGVLNVTPDSFSDGGSFLAPSAALSHAEQLIEAGADFIEVGGDSTRPGSVCCGADAEWHRIEPIVRALAPRCQLAIDTHHATVAARALDYGACLINDVSAGSDREMFPTVARAGCPIVLMYSRCPAPHIFGESPHGDIVTTINRFLDERSRVAVAAGVKPTDIIRDSGLGGFVSANPEDSWTIINRYDEMVAGEGGVMFASSRKGFLKGANENSPLDRDYSSAMTGVTAALHRHGGSEPLYIRTHNVALQRQLLNSLTSLLKR